MTSLYFDCTSGISGDMAVAALLDAGANRSALQEALDSIPVGGFKTEITTVIKNGIACYDFNVILEHDNHDHDMSFLFGETINNEQLIINNSASQDEEHRHHDENNEKEHHHDEHSHNHGDENHEHDEHAHIHHEEHNHNQEHHHDEHHEHIHEGHEHNHGDEHHEHHHHHEHRGLAEITKIIDGTKMTDGARTLAKKIFDILAEAESKAHNCSKEEVHFHEVGAVDSIVDIISAAVCFESLKAERVYSTPLMEGTGTIRCAHGILSVPVPAVANILAAHSIPLSVKNERGEFITPTGAAFLAAIKPKFISPQNFIIKKTGFGAGKRAYKNPSVLRAMLIEETASQNESDTITKLECNIDDCTGENLGFLQERLFANGARDVTVIPCYMKKNRPAFLLQVICDNADVAKMESLIFEHTTTIGIRRVQMERTKLVRRQTEIETPWGKVTAKEVSVNGKTRVYPEYESVKKICEESGAAFVEVMSRCGI